MIKRLLGILAIGILATGCATKTLKVTTPAIAPSAPTLGYVTIESVKDARNFIANPSNPRFPSIEGDKIKDKQLTDKAIGRMRHGVFHNALWNYSLHGEETIYSICERIASNSLSAAGYAVVKKGDAQYDKATPVSVEIVEFWAWMQPKFNIDLHFDGELVIKSQDPTLAAVGKGSHMFSTSFAGPGNWTKVVNLGIENLQANLTNEIKKSAQ